MERSMSTVAICGALLVVAVFARRLSAQTVHVVGGDKGWTVPQGDVSMYSTWASAQEFVIGDILTFNFATNAHDVLQVPKDSYENCSRENAEGVPIKNGPANVTLDAAGEHCFICSIGNHCENGQKLTVTVAASASGPSLSPTAGGPTAQKSPPLAPSGSSSPTVFTAFLFSSLSIAVGFFF